MNVASMGALPLSMPTRAATPAPAESWANGVRHRQEGGSDVYELPAARSGVAQEVKLTPRLWGLLGKKVEVADSQGKVLESHRRWEGFHRVVVATDQDTGVETVFDPKEQTITVTAPRENESGEVHSGLVTRRWTVPAQQSVDATGNNTFTSNLSREQDVFIDHIGYRGSSMPIIVRDDRSYEETSLPKAGQPATRQMEATQSGKREVGSLESSLQGNTLTIVGQDGTARAHELFLAP